MAFTSFMRSLDRHELDGDGDDGELEELEELELEELELEAEALEEEVEALVAAEEVLLAEEASLIDGMIEQIRADKANIETNLHRLPEAIKVSQT